ncbi:LOW QUALITY PROTEIN: hypothetical protein V2J09_000168 [Rumex salicifolius]
MNWLFWNCRGAYKPKFRRSIRHMMKRHDTDILALFETHTVGNLGWVSLVLFGRMQPVRVEEFGYFGNQYIHMRIGARDECVNLIAIYAAPSVSRRSDLWGELRMELDNPVFVGGNFNSIVRLDERTEGNGRLAPDSLDFDNWINEQSLVDMGFKGSHYTWKRGRSAANFIAKRLDRAWLKWHEAVVTHLLFLSSDHAPFFARVRWGIYDVAHSAAWLYHPTYKELLAASWNPELSTPTFLNILRARLNTWNREIRKAVLLEDIRVVQAELEAGQSDELLAKEDSLISELDRKPNGFRNCGRSGLLRVIETLPSSTRRRLVVGDEIG